MGAITVLTSPLSRKASRNAKYFSPAFVSPIELIRKYPELGADEAKAICAEWRATYHERRARLPRG